jgi:hypothetical protein
VQPENHSISESHCNELSGWHVRQCACGQLTLQLGSMRIEFSRTEFAQLHRLLERAVSEFCIASSQQQVHHMGGITH